MRKRTWLIVAAYIAGWLAAPPVLESFADRDQPSVVAEQDAHSVDGVRLASR